MSFAVKVSREVPGMLRRGVRVRNGVSPDYRTGLQIANALNFVATHQRKMIFCVAQNVIDKPAEVAGTNTLWQFYFHSGEASVTQAPLKLTARVILFNPIDVEAEIGEGDLALSWRMVVTKVGGATTNSDYRNVAQKKDANQYVDTMIVQEVSVEIDPNSAYKGYFETTDKFRLMACCVFEEASENMDSGDTILVDPVKYAIGEPITDAQHTNLVTENYHKLFRNNGAHLFTTHYSDEYNVDFTTTSTTQANIYDASTTTNANSLGFWIPTQYWAPVHNTTTGVKFRVAVLGEWDATGTAATGGEVKLYGVSGQIGSTISGWTKTGGGVWVTGDFTIADAAGGTKVDIRFASTEAAKTFTIHAISAYLYQT